MRFESYPRTASTPNVIVDGPRNASTVLALSHWARSGTPPELRADTSTEIVFRVPRQATVPRAGRHRVEQSLRRGRAPGNLRASRSGGWGALSRPVDRRIASGGLRRVPQPGRRSHRFRAWRLFKSRDITAARAHLRAAVSRSNRGALRANAGSSSGVAGESRYVPIVPGKPKTKC